MDETDKAQRISDLYLDVALRNSRSVKVPGPFKCSRCGYTNDRRDEGWAICSDCAEQDEG